MNADNGPGVRRPQQTDIAARQKLRRAHFHAVTQGHAFRFPGKPCKERNDFINRGMRISQVQNPLTGKRRKFKDKHSELSSESLNNRVDKGFKGFIHIKVMCVDAGPTASDIAHKAVGNRLRGLHKKPKIIRHLLSEMPVGLLGERLIVGAVNPCGTENGIGAVGGQPLFRQPGKFQLELPR